MGGERREEGREGRRGEKGGGERREEGREGRRVGGERREGGEKREEMGGKEEEKQKWRGGRKIGRRLTQWHNNP